LLLSASIHARYVVVPWMLAPECVNAHDPFAPVVHVKSGVPCVFPESGSFAPVASASTATPETGLAFASRAVHVTT
jgi:hypothetical protein